MRIALCQTTSPAGDISAGLDAVRSALAEATGAGADILVMQELFLPGYVATGAVPPDEWSGVAGKLAEACRNHGVALAIGLPEYSGDQVYNSAYVFSSQGAEIARTRKVQLFGPDENALFLPGNRLATFDYLGTRIGLVICYDIEFPEHVRALKRAGVAVILVPTANMMPFTYVNDLLVPARAAENALTIAYANYCGPEGPLVFTGRSVIAGPDGSVLAKAVEAPQMLVADVPTEVSIPLSTQIEDLRTVEVSYSGS
ncbi:MAG: carbon-nitrogen hydrolase family protein [Pseudomonadota bacterium]